ncbi:hypothetical protein NBRC116583_12920 [Arenicella sp. 4NH20-0111]
MLLLYKRVVWYFRVNKYLVILGNQQNMMETEVLKETSKIFSDDVTSAYELINEYLNQIIRDK